MAVFSVGDIEEVCMKAKITDGILLKPSEVSLAIQACSINITKSANVSGLNRHECLELLVRLAKEKYVKSKG